MFFMTYWSSSPFFIYATPSFLNYLVLQPFAAVETPGENNPTNSPVRKHSDPDTHRPEAQDTDQENTETEPARPHGTAGGDHGKLHITGCTKTIPRHERHCPYHRLYDGDPCHHVDAHFRTGTLHSAKDRHWSDQSIHTQTAYDNNCLCNDAEFFYVIDRLIFDRHQDTGLR